MQLTRDQERSIQFFIDSGLYTSAEDVVNAALAPVEQQAKVDFEGSHSELEELIREGLNSGKPVVADDAFWRDLKNETDQILSDHAASRRRP